MRSTFLVIVFCGAAFVCRDAASWEPEPASSGAAAGCPAAPPIVGSACGPRGAECSFGDSPLPECRQQFSCVRGQWTKGVSYGTCKQPASCPSAQPAHASAGTSREAGNRCAYPSGALCKCVTELCGGSGCTPLPAPQWFCTQVAAGCPRKVPNVGTACGTSAQTCEYEYCGVTAICRDGVWGWSRICV